MKGSARCLRCGEAKETLFHRYCQCPANDSIEDDVMRLTKNVVEHAFLVIFWRTHVFYTFLVRPRDVRAPENATHSAAVFKFSSSSMSEKKAPPGTSRGLVLKGFGHHLSTKSIKSRLQKHVKNRHAKKKEILFQGGIFGYPLGIGFLLEISLWIPSVPPVAQGSKTTPK